MEITSEHFDELVAAAIDMIPDKYSDVNKHVVFETADWPNDEQRKAAKLNPNTQLFGLFQGVPRAGQVVGASGLLPAKITIFRHPMVDISEDEASLKAQILDTVWHEVAHYFGLSHEAMHDIKKSNGR